MAGPGNNWAEHRGQDDPRFVPDIVKAFCRYFYQHIRERNISEIQSMYESSFLKLSERHYANKPWPAVELIADAVDHDHVFGILYKELYYRHLYARCQPDLRQRCESWDNYCQLFVLLLRSNVNMQLPNVWLWDMIDEFIYQFQSFCQYRGKLTSKSNEEIQLLKECEQVWNVVEVLNVLQALVDKSDIAAELETDGDRFYQTEGLINHQSNVLRMLGYFSLLGLMRVHCLIGDYASALRAVTPLNFNEKSGQLTSKIPSAHITLYYYAGFSYLMLRRYADAARTFNAILAYINRVKQFYARHVQYDQILKKNEQLYALLAMTCALSPSVGKGLEENVATQLKDRNNDKMTKMMKGDVSMFDELFTYGCPKFITTVPPSYDSPGSNTNLLTFRTQLNLFLSEVKSGAMLPILKQYLQLYSSISLSKLASLMEVEDVALRTFLMCLKHKQHSVRWAGGSDPLSGELAGIGEIDFTIDTDLATGKEMVIVSDTVHTRHHADLLVRHICKFEEIIRDIEAPPTLAKPSAAHAY